MYEKHTVEKISLLPDGLDVCGDVLCRLQQKR